MCYSPFSSEEIEYRDLTRMPAEKKNASWEFLFHSEFSLCKARNLENQADNGLI